MIHFKLLFIFFAFNWNWKWWKVVDKDNHSYNFIFNISIVKHPKSCKSMLNITIGPLLFRTAFLI